MIDLIHGDCMEFMRGLPDKAFDLAIVDPPYGIGEDGGKRRQKANRPNSYTAPLKHKPKRWDRQKPSSEYFEELRRVSRHQIVWGANYLSSAIGLDSSCWIVWDKNIGGDQADCELAWTSFPTAIRKFFGHPFIGTNGGKDRIHPTQKPVALYRWLLKNYAKPGQRILDTHLGSGSIAIACDLEGFDLTATEIDADYIAGARKRLADHQSQPRLFDAPRVADPEQLTIDGEDVKEC